MLSKHRVWLAFQTGRDCGSGHGLRYLTWRPASGVNVREKHTTQLLFNNPGSLLIGFHSGNSESTKPLARPSCLTCKHLLLCCSDVLLQLRAEEQRAGILRRSEATVLRASAAAAGITDAAVLPHPNC